MSNSKLDVSTIKDAFQKIKHEQQQYLKQNHDLNDGFVDHSQFVKTRISSALELFDIEIKQRIENELSGYGPIQNLLENDDITEILINQFDQIFYEKNGCLHQHQDHFFDEQSYHQFVELLVSNGNTVINSEKPYVEFHKNFIRYTIIAPDLARGHFLVSLRKQPKSHWNFNKLHVNEWASDKDFEILNRIISDKKNFLVIGGTGSGKTSLLQAFIHAIGDQERTLIIEDTQELQPLYSINTSLLARKSIGQLMSEITMNDLLKKALRLRPDRLCVGEIRGSEATALLMALATGHEGSFGSLHAKSPHEALLRLEMLIQMGAPQWSLQSIRRLIGLTIQNIIVCGKVNGKRKLLGIYEITSVEESGVTLHQINNEEPFSKFT